MVRCVISLEKRILIAFEQAYVEDRLDVAEHLLQALEQMEAHGRCSATLDGAYLMLLHPEERPREGGEVVVSVGDQRSSHVLSNGQ